jgi:hypothetical protein
MSLKHCILIPMETPITRSKKTEPKKGGSSENKAARPSTKKTKTETKEYKKREDYEIKVIKQFHAFTVYDYTSKSVAVTGDTRRISTQLKEAGCAFNGRLQVGPGWVINKLAQDRLMKLIEQEDPPLEVVDESIDVITARLDEAKI